MRNIIINDLFGDYCFVVSGVETNLIFVIPPIG